MRGRKCEEENGEMSAVKSGLTIENIGVSRANIVWFLLKTINLFPSN